MSPIQVEDEFVIGSRRAVEALALAVDELAAIVPGEARIEPAVRLGISGRMRTQSFFPGLLVSSRSEMACGKCSVTSRTRRGGGRRVLDVAGWRCFVLGYTAACLIVRLDMLLLEEVACDSVTH